MNLDNRKQFCVESITCLSQLSGAVNAQAITAADWDEILRKHKLFFYF